MSTVVIRTYWKMTRDGVWIPIHVLDSGGFKPGQPLNGKYEDHALFQQRWLTLQIVHDLFSEILTSSKITFRKPENQKLIKKISGSLRQKLPMAFLTNGVQYPNDGTGAPEVLGDERTYWEGLRSVNWTGWGVDRC
jgi:hypothetical protein